MAFSVNDKVKKLVSDPRAKAVLVKHRTAPPPPGSLRRILQFQKDSLYLHFCAKNGGLPIKGQAAVCVLSYAVFVSFSFLASRKAFFRAPCRLICA